MRALLIADSAWTCLKRASLTSLLEESVEGEEEPPKIPIVKFSDV